MRETASKVSYQQPGDPLNPAAAIISPGGREKTSRAFALGKDSVRTPSAASRARLIRKKRWAGGSPAQRGYVNVMKLR